MSTTSNDLAAARRHFDPTQVPGWGVDADPDNDPTYPYRQRRPDTPRSYDWQRPDQQPLDVEVLHSNERPNVSAVFGTPNPPGGLSGWLRRFAFRFSESNYGHWVPLMLADRVGVVEGIAHDLAHGRIPNILAESGYAARWRHDRARVIAETAATAAIAAAVVAAVVALRNRPTPTPLDRIRHALAELRS